MIFSKSQPLVLANVASAFATQQKAHHLRHPELVNCGLLAGLPSYSTLSLKEPLQGRDRLGSILEDLIVLGVLQCLNLFAYSTLLLCRFIP
jgi:hypothetical protein